MKNVIKSRLRLPTEEVMWGQAAKDRRGCLLSGGNPSASVSGGAPLVPVVKSARLRYRLLRFRLRAARSGGEDRLHAGSQPLVQVPADARAAVPARLYPARDASAIRDNTLALGTTLHADTMKPR